MKLQEADLLQKGFLYSQQGVLFHNLTAIQLRNLLSNDMRLFELQILSSSFYEYHNQLDYVSIFVKKIANMLQIKSNSRTSLLIFTLSLLINYRLKYSQFQNLRRQFFQMFILCTELQNSLVTNIIQL